MSKTIDLQIEKIQTLIHGLRRNAATVAKMGIKSDEVETLEQLTAKLAEASKECDAMRTKLSEKVRDMNGKLVEAREMYLDTKKKIKTTYPQYDWSKYGVMDKR